MTEPRTGPANQAGQPGGSGPPGSGPPASSGPEQSGQVNPGTAASSVGGPGHEPASGSAGMTNPGTGDAGAGTASQGTSRMATATRATGQPTVPQQAGRAEAGYADDGGMDEQMAEPGVGPGAGAISAASAYSWTAVLLGGLGLIAVGIALLVWPSASLTVVAILIGAAVVVSGLVRLYEGFTTRGESGGMRAAYIVIGLVAVTAGLYLLRHHTLSLFFVAFVTGVYFIMHGFSDIGVAISAKVPGRGLRGVLGVFSLAAGILMVVWPGITLVLLLTLVAAWLIFYGCVLAALSFGLRRAAKAISGSAPSARLATST